MTACQELYLIDAACNEVQRLAPARVLPLGNYYPRRWHLSPEGLYCFEAEVFQNDGLSAGRWLLSWHDTHTTVMDAACWILASQLEMALPPAALFIVNGADIKRGMPWVGGSDSSEAICFGWQAADQYQPLPTWDQVLHALTWHARREMIWRCAEPLLWHWLVPLCVSEPVLVDEVMDALAQCAGVTGGTCRPKVKTKQVPASGAQA